MQLVITHALRLLRKDLPRLTDIHQQQFIKAIFPNMPLDKAGEIIEEGKRDEESELSGLIYFRIADKVQKKLAFEGWFIDLMHYPHKNIDLDGGCFFKASTLEEVGVTMSQSTFDKTENPVAQELLEFFKAAVKTIKVVVKSSELVSNPPFAFAKAPVIIVKQDPRTIELEIVTARRYIQSELRAGSDQQLFQFAHSLRSKFAPPTINTVKTDIFGVKFGLDFVERGPREDGNKFGYGCAYILLRNKKDFSEQFEGWFWDENIEDEETFWPSNSIKLSCGRFFIKDTILFTGVHLNNNRIQVDLKNGLPLAESLSKSLKKLGLKFIVEVPQKPKEGEKGYFGSKDHKRVLEDRKRFKESEAAYKAQKKAEKAKK